MQFRWLLPYFVVFLVEIASAADSTVIGSNLTMQDYFIIFIVGILYVNIFVVAVNRIFRRQIPERRGSPVFTGISTLFAFLVIALGSLAIIAAVFILMAIIAQIAMFSWLVAIVSQYFTSVFHLSYGWGVMVGVLALGAIGIVLFILGTYLVILIQGNPFYSRPGTPTRLGLLSTIDRDSGTEFEPLNPTITFQVLHRDHDDPVVDAKIVLKQMNGTRFYEKFTDYHGEVTFKDVGGYGSEYVAYVEGDEKRDRYRVFRKKASPENGR